MPYRFELVAGAGAEIRRGGGCVRRVAVALVAVIALALLPRSSVARRRREPAAGSEVDCGEREAVSTPSVFSRRS